MAEHQGRQLRRNQALVVVGTSYRRSPGIGISMITFNNRLFKADDVLEIQAQGEKILIPRNWFWQLFAPLSPETTGVSLGRATWSYNSGLAEPTVCFYTDVSLLMEQLFQVVVDATRQHSDNSELRMRALEALRDLQALGLIEIPVLSANQLRGRIDGFKWPFVVIAIDSNHILRADGLLFIKVHYADIDGFILDQIETYLDRPVIFELGEHTHSERRAVGVRLVP